MTEDNIRLALQAEWQRAQEALAEAEILWKAGRPTGAVSRSYYAALHAARSLLLTLGLQPRSHRSVRSLLALHFVRSGRLQPALAHALSLAASSREEADYDSSQVFTLEDAEAAIERAREFTDAARRLLLEENWLSP